MRKLARVASIVVNVGELCERHNLNEEDLPLVLRAILCSHLRFVPSLTMAFRRLMRDQGVGWDRARGDAVHKDERRQRVPSTQQYAEENQTVRWRAI